MKFRNFVLQNFPFLEGDFDALTDYQLFCMIAGYMKKSLDKVLGFQKQINAFTKELEYFENYFNTLNIQDEINNKLDEMYEEGSLENLISQYIELATTYVYDNVSDMQEAPNLIAGCYARTSGFYNYNDDGGAYYKIRAKTESDVIDDIVIISLYDNTLVAELIPPKEIRPEIFGAYGDGTHDDTDAFDKMLDYVYLKDEVLWLPNKTMICENKYNIDTITIPSGMQFINIDGHNKGEFLNGGFIINEGCGWNTIVKNISFTGCNTPLDFKYYNIEYGKIIIENCSFYSCTNVALSIKRRSHRVYIKDSLFVNCDKSLYLEDVDMCYFTGNEVETNKELSNNHYEIEQKATYEGTIIVRDNLFVPAIDESAIGCAWIKIGRNATIENNRFSGEHTGIHPICISYDSFSNFNPSNEYMYPIINFVNNPIVAGTGSILLDKMCGEINIHNNSFTKLTPCIEVVSDTTFNNLDYNKLYISIRDNTGKIFNYKNYGWAGVINEINSPIVPMCLQKFIKKYNLFAKNTNCNYVPSVSGKKLTINYNINDLTNTSYLQFIIYGSCNPNPNGSTSYFENFTALLTLKRDYVNGAVNLVPTVKLLTDNTLQHVTLTPTINGVSMIETTDNTLSDDIELEVTYSAHENDATVRFKGIMPIEFIPVSDPEVYYGEDWSTNN